MSLCTPCSPCPPCDSEYPLLCEPLEVTTQAARIIVEDSAGCQKTLQISSSPSIVYWDGGFITFKKVKVGDPNSGGLGYRTIAITN
jgi:hypothetical protein